ncbi:hypothetical protein V2J09_013379 [Rumex salicifolius]
MPAVFSKSFLSTLNPSSSITSIALELRHRGVRNFNIGSLFLSFIHTPTGNAQFQQTDAFLFLSPTFLSFFTPKPSQPGPRLPPTVTSPPRAHGAPSSGSPRQGLPCSTRTTPIRGKVLNSSVAFRVMRKIGVEVQIGINGPAVQMRIFVTRRPEKEVPGNAPK